MSEKTKPYDKNGTTNKKRNSVPILADGIGTRISAAADRLTTRKYAASVMGVSPDALQRYIREENMPSFAAAAALCLASRVRMEWLASGEGSMEIDDILKPASDNESQPLRLDEAKLAEALTTIDRALVLTRRSATPQARARLAAMAYRILVEEDSVSAALSRIMQAVDAATSGDAT